MDLTKRKIRGVIKFMSINVIKNRKKSSYHLFENSWFGNYDQHIKIFIVKHLP